jgi:hypothetical protein
LRRRKPDMSMSNLKERSAEIMMKKYYYHEITGQDRDVLFEMAVEAVRDKALWKWLMKYRLRRWLDMTVYKKF